MNLLEFLSDKKVKSKEKTETISKWLIENKIEINDIVSFAKTTKDATKATCIEAIEYATKKLPGLLNKNGFYFITESLTSKAPRVKWESARVIGNVAKVFSENLDDVIINLLDNSEHEGTVVRWSTAFALGEILKLKTKHNKDLISAIETICEREENNSIKKIYADAIKKSFNENKK